MFTQAIRILKVAKFFIESYMYKIGVQTTYQSHVCSYTCITYALIAYDSNVRAVSLPSTPVTPVSITFHQMEWMLRWHVYFLLNMISLDIFRDVSKILELGLLND